ncbi:OLC1v1013138C3 [Oldenlandia corymbosa var. corymbosa]|uniref:OLC1v1013138C3 n=1 Tax=Oldenlandia corymbosa var. corymbosa TaxID=529605 RepID=A0AAV1E0V4_OLDCO|nr:OLC1v1013138C3 [Oldenlandia corymbosa var. corymbosa]
MLFADTVPPTAQIITSKSFTNASNLQVNISFSEPCGGEGGFQCSSPDACNLLVYGDGQVMPNTLNVIEPNLKYSLTVGLSESVEYGRAIVVLDKSFCSDSAGNRFSRTENSRLLIHIDRRSVLGNLRTRIPEKLVYINQEARSLLATNKNKNLEVYVYFTEPVLNSSTEILALLNTSVGSLLPLNGDTSGNQRFGYQVKDISEVSIVTVSLDSNLVISRQGTPVSPVTPVTFLYDSIRPTVRLRTTSRRRTKDKSIPVLIKFTKAVFGFNSSHMSISGGHLLSFQELSRSVYTMDVRADGGVISISVPENITEDVAGNRNLPSNILQVRHYCVPAVSLVVSSFATAAFALTALLAGFLTISTASLQSVGAFRKPSSLLTSDPSRNLFRMASHIQIYALSRWLAVGLPVEYSEFARGLQWSIPYFSLPWETEKIQPLLTGGSNFPPYSSKIDKSGILVDVVYELHDPSKATMVSGLPLTPMEYRTFFEGGSVIPEADFIMYPQDTNGWRGFKRSMFWLAIIYGSLILLHALFFLIIKFRKKNANKNRSYGALVFPRFHIFLLILALPCLCEASASLVKGREPSGMVVGILLLGFVFFLLLALILFLSIGITLGKLLQYKEVHQEGEKFHWYQEVIRATLGPGKRGQWTWRNQANAIYLTKLGPLFEDLRGPPKYMLSQIAGGNAPKRGERIIDSEDETEDAEAPFIQKLFGILRIYYTLLEAVRRVTLGIVAGAYSENWTSRAPTITLLSITSFQLFFMVLKKPFIKKKIQLVEIISVACEVGIFAACMALVEKKFSAEDETRIGIFMVSLFLVAFLAQLLNEWYALFRQTKRLDHAKNFWSGLKIASIGFLLFFVPRRWIKNFETKFPAANANGDGETNATTTPLGDQRSNSRSSDERPWLRQLRELARSSFNRERSGVSTEDPSTSQGRWNAFWNAKRSGSPSMASSSDFKGKSRGLSKDLEAIFGSK